MQKKQCYANPLIVFRKEGKTGLLFNPLNGSIETLNETGIFIWKLCNGKNSPDDIVHKATTLYAGNKVKIANEVAEFLAKIVKEKYIEVKK